MATDELMHVPLSVEHLLSGLFGKLHYHGYVGGVRKAVWKKDLKKIATYLKKSVELNVQTDALHRKQLLATCDDLIRLLTREEGLHNLNAGAIEHLVQLVFLLLGNMPNHWRLRSPYADRFWKLDGHRTLHYTQTCEQKVHLLLNAIDIRKQIDIELCEYRDLHDAFHRGFDSDPARFLAWFKVNYPAAYCEVF